MSLDQTVKPERDAGTSTLNAAAFWPVRILFGLGAMPYFFILPNLAFFGLFVVVPLFINFAFSVTGGTNFYLDARPYVGAEQYAYLADCANYLDPTTCREDRFWRGVFNTFTFVFFQVALLVLFSMITALILNREIRGRGFFRAAGNGSCCAMAC
jgi:alpha-1,4-digalacturonate transport system permease protein